MDMLPDDGGTMEVFTNLPTWTPKGPSAQHYKVEIPKMPQTLSLGIHANILPADSLASAGGSLEIFAIPRSSTILPSDSLVLADAPPPPPPLPLPGGSSSPSKRLSTEQFVTAEEVLSKLLREVLEMPDISRALETLDEEPIPWFGQIRDSVGGCAPTPPTNHDVLLSTAAPPSAAFGARSDDEMEDLLVQQDKAARARLVAAQRERVRAEQARLEGIRSASEFQEFVESVLEGTLFNLVCEASCGEFSLDTIPRQIVRSVEIQPE